MKRYIPKINDMVYSEGLGVCRVLSINDDTGEFIVRDVRGVENDVLANTVKPLTKETCRTRCGPDLLRRYAFVAMTRYHTSLN